MTKLNYLLEKYNEYRPDDSEKEKIREAYLFALKAHEGQQRKSKEPYIKHPLSVAEILIELKLDWETICAALLHDTLEDTSTTYTDLYHRYGEGVASMVDSLTKIKAAARAQNWEKQKAKAETMRKIITGLTKDVRVLLIKLADRLDNLRTLEYLSDHQKKRIAKETLAIYAPFADKLGLRIFKNRLENLSFKHLKPNRYSHFERRLSIIRGFLSKDIDTLISELVKNLNEQNLNNEVSARFKTPYHLYRLSSDSIIAQPVSIIVSTDSVRECYLALGIIHEKQKPLSGSTIKDYISVPRSNGYQAIHTKIIYKGHVHSIHIQTRTMGLIANYGILAKVDSQAINVYELWINLLKDVAENTSDSKNFLQDLREVARADQIYVCTPKGDYWSFPPNSIVLDFAYRIHTELGHHCAAAFMDDEMKDIYAELKDGALIKIITEESSHPKPEWLNHVKTPKAQRAIRGWLDQQKRVQSREFGEAILRMEFNRFNLDLSDIINTEKFLAIPESLGVKDVEDLLSKIGLGLITSRKVISFFISSREFKKLLNKEKSRFPRFFSNIFGNSRKAHAIEISSIDDVFIKLSKCCNPLPGDDVVGFMSVKHGISVHRVDCQNVKLREKDSDRFIQLKWRQTDYPKRPVRITLLGDTVKDLPGRILTTLHRRNIEVKSFQLSTTPSHMEIDFEIYMYSAEQVDVLLRLFENMRGIHHASRK